MLSLPIPLISSLVLGFLLARMWLTDRRHGPLVGLLALCAAQGVIIALAQHYLVPGMQIVQPITATLIPPMAWVAFQATAVRHFRAVDYLHLAGPLAAVLCLLTNPMLLDTLIPGLFLAYGIAIIWRGATGADGLPRMRIEAGDLPGRIWQVIGAALMASALSDVAIVVAQINGAGWLRPWIISIYSSGMLLIIGGLSLSGALDNVTSEVEATPEQQISDQDTEIVARLDALMAAEHPYLNPDLTLSHLSRRLLVPVKQLSGSINRVTGGNVSKYINNARIAAAQMALEQGASVTNAMLSAGFNTKSNFNREFLRVAGQSPRAWMEANSGAAPE